MRRLTPLAQLRLIRRQAATWLRLQRPLSSASSVQRRTPYADVHSLLDHHSRSPERSLSAFFPPVAEGELFLR